MASPGREPPACGGTPTGFLPRTAYPLARWVRLLALPRGAACAFNALPGTHDKPRCETTLRKTPRFWGSFFPRGIVPPPPRPARPPPAPPGKYPTAPNPKIHCPETEKPSDLFWIEGRIRLPGSLTRGGVRMALTKAVAFRVSAGPVAFRLRVWSGGEPPPTRRSLTACRAARRQDPGEHPSRSATRPPDLSLPIMSSRPDVAVAASGRLGRGVLGFVIAILLVQCFGALPASLGPSGWSIRCGAEHPT